MKILLLLILFICACIYLFHLLTRSSIQEAYEKLEDQNKFIRKIKAFFLGLFHLIAY